MRRRALLLLAIVVIACAAPDARAGDELAPAPAAPKLFPIGVDGKWGYIDRTGKVVIEPKYYWAFPFEEGLALVATGDPKRPVHYIDETGQTVLTPVAFTHDFDSFAGGFARGSIGLGFHFMDRNGKVLEGRFAGTRPFSEGLAAVNINPSRFAPRDERDKGLISDGDRGKWGFIDTSSRLVIDAEYVAVGSFSEGLAPVYVGGRYNRHSGRPEGGSWGYIDRQGALVIKPQFQRAGCFSEGLAPVYTEDGKKGFINTKGEFVIMPQSAMTLGAFREGLAPVAFRHHSYGYIDKQAQVAIPPQFTAAREFSEGFASVRLGNDKWGIIDKTGKFILQPAYNQIHPFRGGLSRVENPGEVGYVNTKGEFVWPMTRWVKPKD